MLFAFSSEQVSSVFPKMFEGGKDLIYGNTDFGTLLGGAATGLFQTVLNMELPSNATTSTGWDFNPFDQSEAVDNLSGLDVLGGLGKLDVLGGLGKLDVLGGLGKISTEDTSAKVDKIKNL